MNIIIKDASFLFFVSVEIYRYFLSVAWLEISQDVGI